jgi:hypothetical protein|tara:strand:+ start:2803 stop:2994 length:192 start_codon:yes stop_codon:yes gene_type:complete
MKDSISFGTIAVIMDHLVYAKNRGDMKKIATTIKDMEDLNDATREILRSIYGARLEDIDGDDS